MFGRVSEGITFLLHFVLLLAPAKLINHPHEWVAPIVGCLADIVFSMLKQSTPAQSLRF